MKTYHVYILKCADGSYYTDFTSSLESQLKSHQLGHRKEAYTYERRPVQLVFESEFKLVAFAAEAKRQIKRWSKAKKEALINGELEKFGTLA